MDALAAAIEPLIPGLRRYALAWTRDAAAAGAQVWLTPELSLSGYPPEDLLFRTAFYAKADEALNVAPA